VAVIRRAEPFYPSKDQSHEGVGHIDFEYAYRTLDSLRRIIMNANSINRPIVSRLSGTALLAGGTLAMIGYAGSSFYLMNSETVIGALHLLASVAIFLGSLLVALGLPGLYVEVLAHTGYLGPISYIATMLMVMINHVVEGALRVLAYPILFADTNIVSHLTTAPPPALVVFVIVKTLLGLTAPLLLGIAILRAGKGGSRWAGIPLIASSIDTLRDFVPALNPSMPILGVLAFILLFLGLIWIGFALVSSGKNFSMGTRHVDQIDIAPFDA
jgi:hypothetical protein